LKKPKKLRRTIPLRRKVLYSSIIVVAFVSGAEIACRLILPADQNSRWAYHRDLVRAIGFGSLNDVLEPDPRRFWRVKSNLDAQRVRGQIGDSGPISFTVSTDESGHRRMPVTPNAAFDVLFLGDSCTFGVAVDDDETFPALLQHKVPVRCTNAGVPGYSAYQGRVTFENMSLDRPPAVVVVSFLFNDNSSWDGLSDAEHAQMLSRTRLIEYSRLLTFLASFKPRASFSAKRGQPERPRLTDSEYAAELRRIVDRCRELNSDPVLLVWPMRQQMSIDQPIVKQQVMRRVASEEDVRLIDLVPLFRSQDKPMFADVVHANAAGHRVIAEELESVFEGLLGP